MGKKPFKQTIYKVTVTTYEDWCDPSDFEEEMSQFQNVNQRTHNIEWKILEEKEFD